MTSRPAISWTELRHASVGLLGLGVEGGANLRRLRALGTVPLLVDDDVAVGEVDGLEVLHGPAGWEALRRCDVVVKTPGVSRYRPEVEALVAHGVPVAGGLGLWLQEAPLDRVACITGTKGKSTTAAVAGHLLERLGHHTLVAGNIGRPPWDPTVGDDYDFWVVETSSFQATDLAVSPPVVAVTSLSPDHLDWHGDAETYFADKLSACSQPGAACTVADGSSALLRAHAELLGPRTVWIPAEPDATGTGTPGTGTAWDAPLGLRGPHNRRNAEIARAVIGQLGVPEAADPARLAVAAADFTPLPSRLRTVATVDGVEFVDDSLSTNVLPALAALATFAGRRVALLVGGQDRGLPYEPLADGVARRHAPTFVVTLPDCGPRIGRAVAAAAAQVGGVDGEVGVSGVGGGVGVETFDAPDLDTAVRAAYQWCRPDGVVLLSPAAPSFGRYRDYRARAAAFTEAARACGPT